MLIWRLTGRTGLSAADYSDSQSTIVISEAERVKVSSFSLAAASFFFWTFSGNERPAYMRGCGV
jgi:hypothetical protein